MPDHDGLKIRNLKGYYGDFQALYGIDLDLEAGAVLAVIGANGAGKSTLIRSICGLLPCERDSIVWQGQAIGDMAAYDVARLGIAVVPEGRQLFPSLSVEENLLIGGQAGRDGPWSLSKVYDLFPVLQERRHQASTSLSGGQQQMVAIGRALMSNPDLVLFDEISLGLAPIIINNIYAALPGIIKSGLTAIVVEQDIARALSVSDRAICLQEGRIALEGPSKDLPREAVNQAYFGI